MKPHQSRITRPILPNRHLFALTCLGTLLGLWLTVQRPHAEEELGLKIERDLVFATVGEHELKLDLFLQLDNKSAPLVVWIHGGGWRAGSRKSPRIQGVTKFGYALASISYRFTDQAIFPAQIHDCKAAIRWLRAHEDRYGYDARWIAVAGSSAGGHLALLLGVSGGEPDMEGNVGIFPDQSSTVQAVIDYFGPSDFILRGQTQPERAYTEKSGSFALLGGRRQGKVSPAMERLASPSSYVSKNDPPLLVFHGDADEVVLLDQSQRIVTLYREAGLSARLFTLVGAGHGEKRFFVGDPFTTMVDFLDRQIQRAR